MGVQTEDKANQLDGKTWLKCSISIWNVESCNIDRNNIIGGNSL